jgi:hypothetical protein
LYCFLFSTHHALQ